MRHRLATFWSRRDPLARLRLGIVAVLLVVGLLAALLGAFLGDHWAGIWLNLGTELMVAGLTFLLVDQLLRQRERQEAEERAAATSQAELIARLGSNVRTFAVVAAEAPRRHGWLTDGSLHGAALMTADLQGAPLSHAQINGANLSDANLHRANLGRAVLAEASLDGANLQGAYLLAADLRGASLVGAKLGGAELVLADLRRRSLIERSEAGLTLQNVVMEYMTERLVEQVVEEIETGTIRLLNSHALMKAQAKEYVRNSQVRLILGEVLAKLEQRLGSREAVVARLTEVLAQLREEGKAQ